MCRTSGSVVPMAKILVTGMSGTGKSSALSELGRRGYRVVETDNPGWSEWVESPDEVGGAEWLWVEDRMADLLQSDDDRTLFVQGCVRNQGKFYDRFGAVVLLSASAEVILDRIAGRETNDWWQAPCRARPDLHQLATVEPLLRAGCSYELDAIRPLAVVVADLIEIAQYV
jgi:AAA domain